VVISTKSELMRGAQKAIASAARQLAANEGKPWFAD
jgi:hypothetical protein